MRTSRQPTAVVLGTRAVHVADAAAQPHLALAAVLGIYAIVLLWITTMPPFGGRAYLAVTDVLGFIPPLLAGMLALVAARRATQHARTGWLLLGLGCLAWGAGDVVWAVYEVILQRNPFPSAADAGYLLMLPLVAIGLIVLTSERRRLAHARPALDGLALVLSAAALVWLFLINPIYASSDATTTEKVVSSAYPIGDMVLIYALVVAVQRGWGQREGAVLSTLLAGMLLLVSADVYFAYLQVNGNYNATSIVNVGWPYGFMLISYAAALGCTWSLSYQADESHIAVREWRLPLALLVLVGGLAIAAARADSAAVSAPLFAMVGIAGLAVVARLAINFGLAHELDGQRERLVTWMMAHKRA